MDPRPVSDARSFETDGPEATEALGEALAALVRPGDVIALHGELGGGKTCFVRGLARGLGVPEGVSSPTFTLMHTYTGRLPLHHLDAWMTERGEGFLADGGAEWLSGDGVAAVEWAEHVRDWLPEARFEVRLEHLAPERRRVGLVWTGVGERLAPLKAPPGTEMG